MAASRTSCSSGRCSSSLIAASQVMGVIDLLLWTAEYQKKKNSWILAWCNALWDNSRVNREVNSNLRVEQPALSTCHDVSWLTTWHSSLVVLCILWTCGTVNIVHTVYRMISNTDSMRQLTCLCCLPVCLSVCLSAWLSVSLWNQTVNLDISCFYIVVNRTSYQVLFVCRDNGRYGSDCHGSYCIQVIWYWSDLMAESEAERRAKIVKWKAGMQVKGLRMNIEKTKVMFSCCTTDRVDEQGKWFCDVCEKGVGRMGRTQCSGMKKLCAR